jgi:hypothetical protein
LTLAVLITLLALRTCQRRDDARVIGRPQAGRCPIGWFVADEVDVLKQRINALFVGADSFFVNRRDQLVALAARRRNRGWPTRAPLVVGAARDGARGEDRE